jgi:hypothetical protein
VQVHLCYPSSAVQTPKKRAQAVFRSTVLPKHPFEKMNPILAVCVLLCGLIAAVSAGTTLCVCVCGGRLLGKVFVLKRNHIFEKLHPFVGGAVNNVMSKSLFIALSLFF